MLRQGDGARQVLSTSTRRLSSSCTAILSSRHDGADLSGLLVRAADDGLLEVLLFLGARVPMIIHRAGLAAIARPEDEAEDHDSADDGTCASERRVSSDPADDARSCRARQCGARADPADDARSCRARDARHSHNTITRSTRGAATPMPAARCDRRALDSTRSLAINTARVDHVLVRDEV